MVNLSPALGQTDDYWKLDNEKWQPMPKEKGQSLLPTKKKDTNKFIKVVKELERKKERKKNEQAGRKTGGMKYRWTDREKECMKERKKDRKKKKEVSPFIEPLPSIKQKSVAAKTSFTFSKKRGGGGTLQIR